MFTHVHPYQPFIPKTATKLIVGTLPPPRFSTGELKPKDVDFNYGSQDGLLWPALNEAFQLNLDFEPTDHAIAQRREFLISRGIGICDIVDQCMRNKIDASDLGMTHIVLRDLVGVLQEHQHITTLLFTGGNTKNGPEYFFRRQLKTFGLQLKLANAEVPKMHQLTLPMPNGTTRMVTTISLTSPSGAANRSIGSMASYKALKQENSAFNTFDFRVEQYRRFF